MSFVITAPEMMTAAATDLAGIGSALSEAHTAAMAATVGLVPAAADEVSAAVTHLFSGYAQGFHELVGKAAASQGQFAEHLKAGAFSYASIEADITSYLAALKQWPADDLSFLASWELGLFGQYGPTEYGFLSNLAALPPQSAIPLLLIFPIYVPLGYFSYMLFNS
jgi:hypothetical protein